MTSKVTLAVVILPLLMLHSCGQVITRVTPTPPPTPTLVLTPVATLRPTFTPAPYTPAPTATPTVTPTPVIYKIASGDSLLKIAGQFDVSVEALQEANGITNPMSLQVGQQLVIPQPQVAAEGTPTPAATATPLPFKVDNITFSRTVLGGLWCLGEVNNTSGVDLEQAGVLVTLLDENQKTVAQAQAPVFADLVAPGAKAPFAVHFTEPPASFASYSVQAATGVRGFLGSYYRDLAARDLKGTGERYAAYTVSGNIVNTGPEDTVEVLVTVTLYDSLGRVIGARRAAPEHNVILRGGQTAFSVELTPGGGPVASYAVQALGRRMPTPTPAPAQ